MLSHTETDLEEKRTELDGLCAALAAEDPEAAGRIRAAGLRAGACVAGYGEDEAAQAYLKMLEEAPGSLPVYRYVALGLIDLERFGDAVEVANEAAHKEPSNPERYLVLGEVCGRIGLYVVAALAYREALELGTADEAGARAALGDCCLHLCRYEQAAAAYERALSLGHEGAEARLHLAESYHALGRNEEAAASCRRALALDPGCDEAHLILGLALLDAGRREEAAATLRRCLELDVELANVSHGALGLAFEELGLYAEAAAAYEDSLELLAGCEGCAEALSRTRELSGRRGGPDEAATSGVAGVVRVVGEVEESDDDEDDGWEDDEVVPY